MFISAAVLQTAGGLTIGEIVRDIPHDGRALIAYAMIALFVVFIWHGSRKQKG